MSNFVAELIGTAILVILGDGVVGGVLLKHSKAENGGWVVITMGWGLAVTLAIFAVGNFSGAHINPAVTLAIAIHGELPWSEVPVYMAGQLAGGILGGVFVWLHYLPHWSKTKNPELKLAVFSTGPAIRSPWANLLSEASGTFILTLGLLFIGATEFTQGLNPVIVGLLILAIGLSLGGTTGYAINPARDLGPRIAHALLPIQGKGSSDWAYSWIPVIGPLVGGAYGALFYEGIFQQSFSVLFWIGTSVIIAIILTALFNQYFKQKTDDS
ncbi:MAG: aquaporin family protein [Bacteroidales bacterium]|nr:aquaporin family protein [Bacteroidales bacterium]